MPWRLPLRAAIGGERSDIFDQRNFRNLIEVLT